MYIQSRLERLALSCSGHHWCQNKQKETFNDSKCISIIETGKDDVDEVTRSHLRRHRPFFFKLDQIPKEDVLKGARFRLYKNISGESNENRTLRVNVYQVKRNSIDGQ